MSDLKVGEAAPDLTLADQDGAEVTLSHLWSKGPLVVFFYPADATYGCTKEVCKFRDGYEDFIQAGASSIVGISKNQGGEVKKNFQKKYNLQFNLLADTADGAANKAFKVKKQLFGLVPGRVTFVVDSDGKIQHVFSSVMDL